jgi:hypothetical protein
MKMSGAYPQPSNSRAANAHYITALAMLALERL